MTYLAARIDNEAYYDYFPPGNHSPGDIWMDLPTHGLLRRHHASAIVVTPSCDLSNRKVNTITYIPVISFLEWVGCRDFLPEVIGSMSSLAEPLSALGISGELPQCSGEVYPSELSIQVQTLNQRLADKGVTKSVRGSCERYLSGAKHLERVSRGERPNLGEIELCISKRRWQQVRCEVVTNSYRSDIYFLPADGNDQSMSPIPYHSVALFRYPLTAPVGVLDSAQDSSLLDWDAAALGLASHEPMARSFTKKPLKCLRLRDRFLSDLLTKFVALYSRLGSPDFTDETVANISKELGESK